MVERCAKRFTLQCLYKCVIAVEELCKFSQRYISHQDIFCNCWYLMVVAITACQTHHFVERVRAYSYSCKNVLNWELSDRLRRILKKDCYDFTYTWGQHNGPTTVIYDDMCLQVFICSICDYITCAKGTYSHKPS